MTDVKETVFLPQTDFPLRAGLAQKEPEILAAWRSMGLSDKLKNANRGQKPFVLHDGPPFANGAMHLGHALNKILKDVVNRTKRMSGHHVPFVPGWDCHGLPIEWKIEQNFRAKGRTKDQVPVPEMIGACRAFAAEWIDIQRDGMKRLGVDADWDNPYLTMAKQAESTIVGELHKFLMAGLLYRAERPTMWSVIEQTSLAEAEVEYHDHKSTSLWVRFPVRSSPLPIVRDASVVIWTTTPWTLPANQAIAYGATIDYAVYRVNEIAEGSPAVVGEKIILARALAESCQKAAKIVDMEEVATFLGESLDGTIAAHPLHTQGYADDRPLWAGDFVTTEAGTGFVHIAPSHGEDDFRLGQKMGAPLVKCVGGDGVYYDSVPLFAGKRILTEDGKEGDANVAVIRAIAAAGGLFGKATITHSYPHSWRSKAPVIYRTTPQWFVALDKPLAHLNGQTLRTRALDEIKNKVRWIPEQGQNRIYAMIENRHDWCLSRQRMWGVPLGIFIRKVDGEPLMDVGVNARIAQAFAEDGIEAWHSRDPQSFLGADYSLADYDQVMDTADVWFDSASTHAFVLEQRDGLSSPADLYLEGSDQHRGWFHSSLLESVGTRGHAPYKAVLTHGFLLDEKGYKQSKSLGNVQDPADVIKDYGADVLRLALINCDSRNDVSIGPNIIKQQAEQYRRLRNTLRYLLGALAGFDESERVGQGEMPVLERWVLHRLSEIDATLKEAMEDYDFLHYFRTLHDFCAVDLSAFYFDVRKDSLYCDAKTAPTRRATRTVMEQLFLCLTAWLAPILCFTAEEAWTSWGRGAEESVHLRLFPVLPTAWRDEALGERMKQVRAVRSIATTALEVKRSEGTIRSSLEAALALHLTPDHLAAVADFDMADICITSACAIDSASESSAQVSVAVGDKCERCWKVLPEVANNAQKLCLRCEAVVGKEMKL